LLRYEQHGVDVALARDLCGWMFTDRLPDVGFLVTRWTRGGVVALKFALLVRERLSDRSPVG
jgi:hypothetical protein